MTQELLGTLSLVAAIKPAPAVIPLRSRWKHSVTEGERTWPNYEGCASDAPPAKGRRRPESQQSGFFLVHGGAAQRGWSIEKTANKLLEVSAKAQERARLHDEVCAHHCTECSSSGNARPTDGQG